jgi:hypothetical protein
VVTVVRVAVYADAGGHAAIVLVGDNSLPPEVGG